MYADIIALSIPGLVAMVVVEWLVDRRKPEPQYRLNRTVSNMSCGVFEQITGFISKSFFAALYIALYEHLRLVSLPDSSAWTWVGLVLAVDLIFYGFHVACHHTNLLWSGHVIHHETEEFNLTVALRRSVLQEFLIIPVYLPLAVVGFSPGAFFLIFAAHNLYQFYIHTPYFPELRGLGWILNTPHHHRVHHARNARYLDKNFGGIFIVWDKLFGTFEPLIEKPEYGVHQRTTTLNPVIAQFQTLARVLRRASARRGWRAQLAVLFEAPSWLGQEDAPHVRDPLTGRHQRYEPLLTPRRRHLVLALFGSVVVGVTVYRNWEASLTTAQQLAVLFTLGTAVYVIGRLLDGRSRALLGLAPSLRSTHHGEITRSGDSVTGA